MRVFFSFVLTLFLLTSSACGGDKVAEFKGGSISKQELEKNAQMQLYQLKKQEYEIKKQALDKLLEKKLLRMEANAKGVSVDQLLEDLYKKQYQETPEEQRRQYYEANKDRIGRSYEEVKEDLKSGFEQHNKNEIKKNYIESLKKKYNVQIYLEEPRPPKIQIDTDDDPFWGNPNAKVVVVEFSDFQCPFCKRMQKDIQRIRAEYKDKIKWVFRDFPLPFHQLAMQAHIAANCALEQNRYWDMQQALFQLNPNLSKENILTTARHLGLDVARLENCMKDPDGKIRAEIQHDMEYGQQVGVRGTPTIFINGEYVSGVRPYPVLKQMIESALSQ
ncbi:MAG: hypothetical protein D6767_08630 [Candidatus Hydrogenedentota bacterium]|nr:MAG: hypothetical protein D6767_08630 [Candidatus Hydrogenedentota bacterium]